ncbi:uncharacterized protein LOC135127288 [Zophobas morio]
MAVIYLCPADKSLACCWEGCVGEIKQHFENEHNGLLFRTNNIEIDLDKLPENKLLYLEEELFLMQNCIDRDKLIVKLRYLGSNEAAAKMNYDLSIAVNEISYRYNPGFFSTVVPTTQGWEINLDCLKRFHAEVKTVTCKIILEEIFTQKRRSSDTSLKINNKFVESNAIDTTVAEMLHDLTFLEDKIQKLHQQKSQERTPTEESLLEMLDGLAFLEDKIKSKHSGDESDDKKRESGDYMDRISQLNLSMLEEPFTEKYEEYKNEYLSDSLPNIPEELNLSCSTCHLDMLPPIYLCANGHNVCSWCKSKPCKLCNGTVTITRNTHLENISRTHLHQCRYSPEGCSERLLYNEVRAHEAKCNFCKYKCMCDCPYEGKFKEFSNHLKILHSSVKIVQHPKADFPKNSELYIVHNTVGIFHCKSEIVDDFLIWRATFCGPSERQFFCEIAFKGSKYKEPIFLKRKGNVYEIRKPLAELKKNKAKEKYAVLTITSYDS